MTTTARTASRIRIMNHTLSTACVRILNHTLTIACAATRLRAMNHTLTTAHEAAGRQRPRPPAQASDAPTRLIPRRCQRLRHPSARVVALGQGRPARGRTKASLARPKPLSRCGSPLAECGKAS